MVNGKLLELSRLSERHGMKAAFHYSSIIKAVYAALPEGYRIELHKSLPWKAGGKYRQPEEFFEAFLEWAPEECCGISNELILAQGMT